MITMELNEHIVDDWRAAEELRKMGFSDETIQELYNASQERRSGNAE